MDIHMPAMSGYETTRRIMETRPVPIVICTASFASADASNTFRALEAGALALVSKPVGPGHHQFEEMAAKLVETVFLMSEVKLVRRRPLVPRTIRPCTAADPIQLPAAKGHSVVAIGVSTGGPPVLQTILAGLPKNFPQPLLIVQHIASGFLTGLVEWLEQTTGFPTTIAQQGESLEPGHAYLAPDFHHLGVTPQGRVALSMAAPDNGLRPSVAHLFHSVAKASGAHAVAILLTGMGRDGAKELKELRDAGAVTIAQDAKSSIVHGMPGEAIKLDAATYVRSPEQIPALLIELSVARSRRAGVPT